MKRFIAFLFALFYLTTASGADVNLHYCMDKLVDWSVFKNDSSKCEFCGMEKKSATKEECCKDVQHQVQIDNAQQINIHSFSFEQMAFHIVMPLFREVQFALLPSNKQFAIKANAPPLGSTIPIFISNCTYRI